MELIIFFGTTLTVALLFFVCMTIDKVAAELRGIRSVLMAHAQLEPVPVREEDPSNYQRKHGSPPAC